VNRAAFLDRDGTIIVDAGYPRDPAAVQIMPFAIDALLEIQQRFLLVVISNQSGLGRGLITQPEAQAVHDRVMQEYWRAGVRFADAYYCPHAPEAGCTCRKPAPGLLLTAAAALGIDLARSVMIGDKPSDIMAGRAAGVMTTIRFGADRDGVDGHARCDDWIAVRRYMALMVD
jgi:histidinol-phosphate phosphatase family protein